MDYLSYYRQTPINNNETIVLDSKTSDVNGDNIKDNIYLEGTKPLGPDSLVVGDIKVVIQDGKTRRSYEIPLKVDKGYTPKLFLGSFTDDRVDDILISIESGNTGEEGYYYIYSFVNNNHRLMFDFEEFNNKYKYDVTYKNNYTVEVKSEILDKTFIINLKNKNESYLRELYNQDGTLKKQYKGYVSPLVNLHPVASESDYGYDLYAVQRVVGYYNADTLGMIITPLVWDKRGFTTTKSGPYLTLFGTDQFAK
jgi:hypothetical protein